MKKTKLTISDIVAYAAVTCIGNLIATFVAEMIHKYLITPIGEHNFLTYVLYFLTYSFLTMGIAWCLIYLLFKQKEEEHYVPSDDKHLWMKKCLLMIAPGEIIRFLICLRVLGITNVLGGKMAIAPTIWFGNSYLIWADRVNAVRQEGIFIIWDYLAYSLCYLIYLAIYLYVIFEIYLKIWKKGKQEHDYLIEE